MRYTYAKAFIFLFLFLAWSVGGDTLPPPSIMVTIAGSYEAYRYAGDGGFATSAQLYQAMGLAVDGSGNLFIADTYNHAVRRVDGVTRVITIVAGAGELGVGCGPGGCTPGSYEDPGNSPTNSNLHYPSAVAVTQDSSTLFIADSHNFAIRRVVRPSAGNLSAISTVVGIVLGSPLTVGSAVTIPAQGASIQLAGPVALCLSPDGTMLYYSDNYAIFRLDISSGQVSAFAGVQGSIRQDNGGTQSQPATSASFIETPTAMWMDASQNMYIVDSNKHIIRKVDSGGYITTPLGQFNVSYNSTDVNLGDVIQVGAGTSAKFKFPVGLSGDANGNLYVADTSNFVLRKVSVQTEGSLMTYSVSHFAGMISEGQGVPGTSGDGAATSSKLAGPVAVAVDVSGNVYFIDCGAYKVYYHDDDNYHVCDYSVVRAVYATPHLPSPTMELTIQPSTQPWAEPSARPTSLHRRATIVTVAGTGVAGSAGDGGPATRALLNAPNAVAVDAMGNVYISDGANHVVRMVHAGTGNISTFAGTMGGGDSSAQLNQPKGVAVDASGNVYISDQVLANLLFFPVSTVLWSHVIPIPPPPARHLPRATS